MGSKIKAFGEVMMRLATPDFLTLQQTSTLHVTYTGTGLNVLSALSQYGYNTSLISKLPNNSIGRAAMAHIRSLGIGTDDIVCGGDYIGKYFLEEGFDVRPTKVTYSNRIESSFCTSHMDDYDLEEIFKETKMIHFCGITLAMSDEIRELVLHIAKEAKKREIIVILDCNYRPKLWDHRYDVARGWYEQLLHYVDICMMTDRDAEFVLGMETAYTDHKEKLEDLLPRVAEKYEIPYLAGTIRGKGVGGKQQSIQGFLCSKSEFHYSESYRFNVLDRIGAGDGYASGIIYGYDHGLSDSEIVEFATAAGVLAHTTYGDSPICTADEVWGLINGDGEEIER